jgi:hypothetical protein
MFKEGKKGLGSAIALSTLMFLTGCGENSSRGGVGNKGPENKTSFGMLEKKFANIQKQTDQDNPSEELQYKSNADVIARAAEELCKEGRKECSVTVVDKGKEFFVYITVDGLPTLFSLRNDGSQLDVRKAKNMINNAQRAHNLPF